MSASKNPYRESGGPKSETMKVIVQAEREMLETFAHLLSETNPHLLGQYTRKLEMLAHERQLAIRLETARRMVMPTEFSFVVVDGVLDRVVTMSEEKAER